MAHVLTRKAYPKDGALGPWAGEVYVFPTTVAQQGFWFFDRLEPGNPAYNIAVRFRLRGVLRIAKLERAMNEVVRRHESLRTIFTEADGEPVQVVAPALTLPMSLVDLGGLPRRGRFERAEAVAEEEARGRFELTAGPLLRYTLVRLDPNDHVLLLTVHHIVADGWSIGLIAHELGTHYDAYDRGVEPAPTPLPLQYGDFAAWQKLWLGHGDLDQKLAYWARTLRGLATLELPTDHPRSAAPTSEGDIVSVLLPVGLTETLKALCHSRGVTLFMLTLAALKVILRRRIGQDDVFVGTLIAGRSKTELEPLIGPFINCLVLRTDLSGDPTFLELLDRVRETGLQAITHGEVPFERVVEAVQPKRDPSRHPLFQINFIFQRDFVRPFHAANLTLTAMPSKSPGAIYDLNVFMVEREEGWRASCEYNTGLYEASTVQTLLELFESLLHDLAADPSRPISRYAIANADRPVPGGLTARRPENPAAPVSLQATDGADVEGALMGLWERTLGEGPVGLDDDFFDFGGHSLLAMRLLAQIESTFGKRVALAIFLQAPTVKAVAARLREEATRSRLDQTIVLQAKGRGVPFVLVDTGPYFRTLVRRMGDAHPVYGLILPELPDLPPRFTVADIAANLIEALRAVQPHGPYQLGGWCHAGLIAVEMARLLRARGERVDRPVRHRQPPLRATLPGPGGPARAALLQVREVDLPLGELAAARPPGVGRVS